MTEISSSFRRTGTDTGNDLDQLQTWIAIQRARIHSAVVQAMTEIGGLATDSLIQRLNTPYPPASGPDEDPHRRTGLLSAGVHFIMEDQPDHVTAYLVSDREGSGNVPLWLEEGTTRGLAPRRYMLRTKEQWQDQFAPQFESIFLGALQ